MQKYFFLRREMASGMLYLEPHPTIESAKQHAQYMYEITGEDDYEIVEMNEVSVTKHT